MTSPQKNLRSAELQWQRVLLAFFAILFLALGLGLDTIPGIDASSRKYAAGTFLKVGVVLGLVWIAAPQLDRFGWQRLKGSLLVVVILVCGLIAVRPKFGAIVGAIFVVGSLAFSLVGWVRQFTRPPK